MSKIKPIHLINQFGYRCKAMSFLKTRKGVNFMPDWGNFFRGYDVGISKSAGTWSEFPLTSHQIEREIEEYQRECERQDREYEIQMQMREQQMEEEKQLIEDKKRYPLFFLKEGIV